MKRVLSFVLAMAMLIGLLPSITFAADAVENPVYNFTVSAIADETIIDTDSKNTKSVQVNKVTDASQLRADVSTGAWTHYATVGFATFALYSGNVQARVNPAYIDANGTVLKTSFANDATYSATIKFAKSTANGRTNIYFVPVSYAATKTWDMATADGINAAIADSANESSPVALAASVDMHQNATDASPFKGNTFDVTAGDYYIIINITDDSVKGESDRYFSMISAIELTKATAEVDVRDLKYDFTLAGAGEDVSAITETNSVVNLKRKNIAPGDGNTADESGDDWTYVEDSGGYYTNVAGPDYLQQLTENGFWGYAASTSYNPVGMNGVVFKLNVPATGTYTPKLNAIAAPNSPVYYAYLIDDAINGKSYTNYSGSEYTFDFENDAYDSVSVATSMLKAGFAYTLPVEMKLAVTGSLEASNPVATTPTALTGEAIELEAGTYYLLVSQESTGRFRTYLNSFELVAAGEEKEPVLNPKYVFNYHVIGNPNNGVAVSIDNMPNYTFDNTVSTGLWSYVTKPNITTANLMSTYISFYTANYTPNNDNALVLELEVDADGTYKPTMDFQEETYCGLLDVYLVKKDYATTKGWDTFDNSTIAATVSAMIAESSMTDPDANVKHLASVDLNSKSSASATDKRASLINLTAGKYYLFGVINEAEVLNTVHTNPRTYAEIKYLQLTYQEKKPDLTAIEADFGETFVGYKLEPTVKWFSDSSELDGAEGTVALEIKKNDDGALMLAENGGIYTVGEGKATITVTGTLRDVEKSVDVEIDVTTDTSWAGKGMSQSYLFYQNAYIGEGSYSVTVKDRGDGNKATTGDPLSKENFLSSAAANEYSAVRPWAFIATNASRPNSAGTYFAQTADYMDFSGETNGWVAMKVKVPAAGKYVVDMAAYQYASGGLAKVFMLPYDESMTYDSVTANIASYMVEENLVAEADFYSSVRGTATQSGVGEFVASDELDYATNGYAEYLMIVQGCASSKGGKSIVMPYGIYINGEPPLASVKTDFDYLTIATGDTTNITGTTGYNAVGNVIDTSSAYVEYSLAEGSEDILEMSEDGLSYTAKKEGTATVITTAVGNGSVCTSETEITVTDDIKIANAYIYATKTYKIGDVLDFTVRLEQNNKKVVSDGVITGYEVVEGEDVIELSSDGKTAEAVAAGTAKIKAFISARGNTYESDTLTITIPEFAGYPATFKLDFRTGAYSGISAVDAAKEYATDRNWIYHSMSESSTSLTNFSFKPAGSFTQIGWTSSGITAGKAYLAFKAQFSEAGPYTIESVGYCRDRSPRLELYLIPTSVEDGSTIASKLVKDNEYYFGIGEHYLPQNPGKYDYSVSFGTNEIDAAGEYFVVFKPVVGDAFEKYAASGGDVWYISYISFANGNAMTSASMSFEKTSFALDETTTPVVKLYDGTGTEIENGMAEAESVIWKTSNSSVATVDRNGTVTAVSEGTAKITAVVTHGGMTKEAVGEIEVVDNSGIEPNLGITLESDKESIYVYGAANLSVIAAMNSGKEVKVPSEYITWEIISGSEFITLEQSGRVSGVDMGTAVVKASVSADWKEGADTFTIKPIEIVVGWDAEVDPQIYTMKERENAIKNANRYSWARDDVKAKKENGDKWVENLDWLYENMIPEGLPRYYHVGHKYDPKKFYCRYCNENIGLEYGSYAWAMNPMQDEWKIQCPSCKRHFPSNDFGSFYELGLSENGTTWSFEKALQKHHEMFVCEDGVNCTHEALDISLRGSEEWYTFYGYGVEGGYLTNNLYGELNDPRWGVDDSRGYLQKYVSAEEAAEIAAAKYNGDISKVIGYDASYSADANGNAKYASGPVQHTYIAYYVHEGIWYGAGSVANSALVKNAISDLRLAFAYTGEAKYGRAGAILLDRLADMYPHFDWYQWHNFRGDSYRGNIADPVWSTGIAQTFAEAYDSFKPIYNDPYVVEYLSEKGAIYEEDESGNYKYDEDGNLIPVNLKDSPGAVRKNAEDNILITIYNDTLKGKIWGNFGMHQSAVAAAAVALNRMPETGEMLEWIMRDGTGYNTGAEKADPIEGGYVMKNLIEEVDRDGIGNENAPGYNRLWITNLIEIAKYLAEYEGYDGANLFENVKFVNMFPALVRVTLGGYYGAQIGDSGATASRGIVMNLSDSLTGFKYTGDRMLAQAIYLYNENTTEGLYGSILDDDPEQLAKDIEKIIEEDGELALDSDMLTGFGFAVLRAGANNKSASVTTATNTIRDMAIYYGANTGHGHYDTLNLYMSAFGLNIAPDLGYPEQTGTQPNRMEWVDAAISHNTVIVDEKEQGSMGTPGTPHHFDDNGRVKLMDVEADVYSQTDEYRRSVVMVEVDDENSYGVDFFHVSGGDDHLYSFHSQSDELTAISGLSDVEKTPMYTDAEGNTYGTYAGADVKYGPDPGGVSKGIYPHGYTWLYNVRTHNTIENNFSVEWNVKDWNKRMTQSRDVRLRLTMVNDEPVSEVTFATALPPQTVNNKDIGELDYLLVRREGQNLDTTFTTVLEPYENGKQYIKSIEKVLVERAAGVKPGLSDAFSAVKVILNSGRIDYIIYSNNSDIEYVVDNKIKFKGFMGVASFENVDGEEKLVYSYLNDGEILALVSDEEVATNLPAYTGTVKSFTKDLEFENSIVYTPTAGQDVDVDSLAGKYVYVDNDGVQNGAYKIESAEKSGSDIVLNVGMVSFVRKFVDSEDMSLGYVYNISEGQSLRIPLASIYSSAPVFEEIPDQTTSAGSTLTFPIKVESPLGKELTFIETSLPRGMVIDAETQTVTWKPSSSQVGENHVAITATDGTLETTVHFYVTVYGSTTGGGSSQGSSGIGSTGGSGSAGSTGGAGSAGTGSSDEKDNTTDSSTSGESEGIGAPSTGSGTTSGMSFADLGNHSWAEEAINTLAEEGVIKGTTGNTYSPAKNITRADFAILLVRAFKLTSENTENFDDVLDTDYFASELAIARNTGIVNGIGDNKYAPRNTITRQDMMVITYRMLGKLGVELEIADVDYPDFDKVAPYAQDAVKALITSGLINGKNGIIDPLANTTRAETAVLIRRILDYTAK